MNPVLFKAMINIRVGIRARIAIFLFSILHSITLKASANNIRFECINQKLQTAQNTTINLL